MNPKVWNKIVEVSSKGSSEKLAIYHLIQVYRDLKSLAPENCTDDQVIERLLQDMRSKGLNAPEEEKVRKALQNALSTPLPS